MIFADTHLPILLVLVPLVAAVFSAITRSGSVAWGIATIACATSVAIAVLLAHKVFASAEPISYVMGGWTVPYGIEYRVDRLNAFVALLVTAISFAGAIYARKSVAIEMESHQQAWFYTMYLLCVAGLLGITITGDAFNAFVFLEISSLSSYVLIALGRHRRALLASYQYLIMGTIGATFYVIGIGLLYLVTGTLNFADIASRLAAASNQYPQPVIAAFAFLTVGISLKLALFPLHVWLPNAYANAPSAATVLLAGTATKVAVYLLIRIFYSVFGPALWFENLPIHGILIALSLAAMVLASLSAVFESDVKRMLAYSSVAQIGYMTLGIAIANLSGLTGAIVHMLNHGIMKAGLFMTLGAITVRLGTAHISNFDGIGRRMPITMAVFVVCGLGLIGVPGTAGFISKWLLVQGAIEAGYWPIALVIVASSLIAVAYVWRVVEAAYLKEPVEASVDARDPVTSMLLPMIAAAAATLYLGLDTELGSGLAREAASMLIGGLK